MDIQSVPQEGNKTLAGERKAVYAKSEQGDIVAVPSAGWEAEEIVTTQAVDELKRLSQEAYMQVKQGQASPLLYWMYAQRMDDALLAQTSGVWRWRVKRHFRLDVFKRLNPKILSRYAEALGLSVEQLKSLP